MIIKQYLLANNKFLLIAGKPLFVGLVRTLDPSGKEVDDIVVPLTSQQRTGTAIFRTADRFYFSAPVLSEETPTNTLIELRVGEEGEWMNYELFNQTVLAMTDMRVDDGGFDFYIRVSRPGNEEVRVTFSPNFL